MGRRLRNMVGFVRRGGGSARGANDKKKKLSRRQTEIIMSDTDSDSLLLFSREHLSCGV